MLDLVGNVGEGLLISAAVAAAVSLVLRTFRTQGVERLQMKWFAFSVLFLPVAFLVGEAIQPLDPTEKDAFTFLLIMVALLGIPASMGIVILRHRLYAIDVLSTGLSFMRCLQRYLPVHICSRCWPSNPFCRCRTSHRRSWPHQRLRW